MHRRKRKDAPPGAELTEAQKAERDARLASLGVRAREVARSLREATEALNESLRRLEEVLRERWPNRAAAIDLPAGDGGVCLLYWQGLWIIDQRLGRQPLLSASREIRMLAAGSVEDLVIQLLEEDESLG